jgi:hypothetical protein
MFAQDFPDGEFGCAEDRLRSDGCWQGHFTVDDSESGGFKER